MIKSYKLRRHIANAFVYLFLIVMGFVWISPFIYLLMHSFRGGAEIYGSTIIPQEWTLQNYIDLFTGSGGTASLNFPRWFLNTFVVACFPGCCSARCPGDTGRICSVGRYSMLYCMCFPADFYALQSTGEKLNFWLPDTNHSAPQREVQSQTQSDSALSLHVP